MANLFHQVLVIFSDGFDEDVVMLENESELLRQSGKNSFTCSLLNINLQRHFTSAASSLAGVNALLVVALEGARYPAQLQMVEFGRGFGYKLPLSIGVPSIGSTILKQIVSDSCRCR